MASQIMIVDDVSENRKLLASIILKYTKYRVTMFRSAIDVLDRLEEIESDPPNVILLDVMMPDMDGFELLKVLKSRDIMKNIPIIFITALNDTPSKVKSFELGGADYISKPFNKQELIARVQVQVDLKNATEAMVQEAKFRKNTEERNEKLELEVIEQKKFETLNIVTNSVVAQMHKNIDYLDGLFESLEDFLLENNIGDGQLLNLIGTSKKRISEMQALKKHLEMSSSSNSTDHKSFHLSDMLAACLFVFEKEIGANNISIENTVSIELPFCLGDANSVQQILLNVLQNAIEATAKIQTEKIISISAELQKDEIALSILDNGAGISLKDYEHIFEPFISSKNDESKGWGLAIVRYLANELDIRYDFHSEAGEGTEVQFFFTIE